MSCRAELFAGFKETIDAYLDDSDINYILDAWLPVMKKVVKELLRRRPTKDKVNEHLAIWFAEKAGAPIVACSALKRWAAHEQIAASNLSPDADFVVTVKRSETEQHMGIQVNFPGKTYVTVHAVLDTGLVPSWNATHEESQQILKGDRIVQVNGSANNVDRMLSEIATSDTLEMHVRKMCTPASPIVEMRAVPVVSAQLKDSPGICKPNPLVPSLRSSTGRVKMGSQIIEAYSTEVMLDIIVLTGRSQWMTCRRIFNGLALGTGKPCT